MGVEAPHTPSEMKHLLREVARPPALLLRAFGICPPERLFRHLHRCGPFSITLPSGRGRLRLMSWGNRVENELFWRGWIGHEPELMRWWARLALEAQCVLDIGANTGTFAFIAKALRPSAQVHAFEPLARIAAMMAENAVVSGLDVVRSQVAVADQSGEAIIHDPGGGNVYSASLRADFLPGRKEAYSVPVTSVDEHCARFGLEPDLIKIDVEGAEGDVLLGAEETISRFQPVVLCEWAGGASANGGARRMMENAGYQFFDPKLSQRVSLEGYRSHEDRNVLMLPGSRASLELARGPLLR